MKLFIDTSDSEKIVVGFDDKRFDTAAKTVASIDKIKKELSWVPKYGLQEIIESAYKWHKTHPKGYKS